MNKTEVLKLALAFINDVTPGGWAAPVLRRNEVISKIKEALAQPEHESYDLLHAYMSGYHDGKKSQLEQKPMAWMTGYETLMHANDHARWVAFDGGKGCENFSDYTIPLYTTPPKRKEWVGLNAAHMDEITEDAISIVDAILLTEAKLKELNHD